MVPPKASQKALALFGVHFTVQGMCAACAARMWRLGATGLKTDRRPEVGTGQATSWHDPTDRHPEVGTVVNDCGGRRAGQSGVKRRGVYDLTESDIPSSLGVCARACAGACTGSLALFK